MLVRVSGPLLEVMKVPPGLPPQHLERHVQSPYRYPRSGNVPQPEKEADKSSLRIGVMWCNEVPTKLRDGLNVPESFHPERTRARHSAHIARYESDEKSYTHIRMSKVYVHIWNMNIIAYLSDAAEVAIKTPRAVFKTLQGGVRNPLGQCTP